MAVKRSLVPLEKRSIEALATDNLREYILSGALQPGERITETTLADQMGIGRATLRTGLHQLATEGLLVKKPYTSWEVKSLTADDAWELWTLRASLESLAIRLAAENMTPQLQKMIEEAMNNLVHACMKGSVHDASECDFALHRTLIECVGHKRLAEQYRLVEQQVRLYIQISNQLMTGNLPGIIEQHRPMIDALLRGDAMAAAHEAWAHNESEGGKLVAWLHQRARLESAIKR
ncbi:GntR family transcriptional regulator [Pantoea cypripedii]|uniref:GntR family transcriptional regulator n=1 Tax=Pantoea cypripedii TaxID=55209 RepID=A0A6B9GHP2_PANCY|nr:GntR family transcriptional regulator [Pantoea cypripedii]QGY32966.1 GntR family transcriptional regulator [Pantoea cypripedii]